MGEFRSYRFLFSTIDHHGDQENILNYIKNRVINISSYTSDLHNKLRDEYRIIANKTEHDSANTTGSRTRTKDA